MKKSLKLVCSSMLVLLMVVGLIPMDPVHAVDVQFNVINSISIAGYEPPYVGGHPDFSVEPVDEGFAITEVCWIKEGSGEMTADDVFEAGNVYYVEFYVTEDEEYAFEDATLVNSAVYWSEGSIEPDEQEIIYNTGQDGYNYVMGLRLKYTLTGSNQKASWEKNNRGWWYQYPDGSYPCSIFLEIDGKVYYFDDDGYMHTGWLKKDGFWYYFDSSGSMLTGWQWIDGDCYYFKPEGSMVTDTYIGGDYVNSDGVWVQDQWIYSTYAGKYWYRHADGSYTSNEIERIGDKIYSFDENGYMQTGWVYVAAHPLMGEGWAYFDGSGAMHVGWLKLGSTWYYIPEQSPMVTGLCELDTKLYYFDESGAMQTGWEYIDGSWYYFNGSGAAVTDWQWIDGDWYYFYAEGQMAASEYIGSYYMDKSGAWVPDQWIYSNYAKKYWYRFGDGTYPAGETYIIDDAEYYFDQDGYMVTGWVYGSIEEMEGWYYFDGSGRLLTGWQYIGSDWYYLELDGLMAHGLWLINDKNYLFTDGGAMLTDWQFYDGSWYYLTSSGAGLTGWNWIDGKCYYFYEDSHMASDETIDGSYVDKSGAWVEK